VQLNHLDLAVPDVALTANFFRTVFGFVDVQTKGNGGLAILKGSGGFELVLTRTQRTDEPLYPKTFHVGFLVSSEQDVMDAFQRVTAVVPGSLDPPRMVRGSLLFYCHAPGGILVEVSHRLTA
jgi:catechol 2,3-dioxygenase-like lactoylglutathione lyase family enzyme